MSSVVIAALLTVTALVDSSVITRSQIISSLQRLKHMFNNITHLIHSVTAIRGKLTINSVGRLLTYTPFKTTAKQILPVSERQRLRTTAIKRSRRIQTMLNQKPSRTIPAVDNMRINMLETNLIKQVFA